MIKAIIFHILKTINDIFLTVWIEKLYVLVKDLENQLFFTEEKCSQ